MSFEIKFYTPQTPSPVDPHPLSLNAKGMSRSKAQTWRACDHCYRVKRRCERPGGVGTPCTCCKKSNKECTLLRAMNLRCGPKQGSQKRRNTTQNAIFHHQRNFDPSDFVPAPDVTLTPSSDSGIPEVSIEGLDLSESEMMTSSSGASSSSLESAMITDYNDGEISAGYQASGAVDHTMSAPSTSQYIYSFEISQTAGFVQSFYLSAHAHTQN
ncbi:hypothetical protein BT96DRAFT_66107 [Gymnopus androsaceus JB14]|uniref:Zn(2)-C6 fungal-type domain-containing protein n=1 Tax=Gymnopus androsaceus JB14 TaxID=1447944 RepID=A0A6A4HKQ7_9AGAR|nr:hypothetical protein BT96DRAFT_66107 [Gymnopus androsaceus JB14]